MNRSNRLKNKNSRRFSFSNNLAKEVLLERMEDRILPAYVSGEFGWAASIDSANAQVQANDGWLTTRSTTVDAAGNVYQVGSFSGTVDFDPGPGVFNLSATGLTDIFLMKQVLV